jgi:hypothetical protein
MIAEIGDYALILVLLQASLPLYGAAGDRARA